MSSRPKKASWFAGFWIGADRLIPYLSPQRIVDSCTSSNNFISIIKISTTVRGVCVCVISLLCRTPAPPSEIALATPTADFSGSPSSSTTSSGTLKSFWWGQMGSQLWGGTQASACPQSELTSETTFSARPLLKIKTEQWQRPNGVQTSSQQLLTREGGMLNEEEAWKQ